MRITGIVAEYNPFHNGHAYQIASARELCGADYIVCVMSGSFVQRGGPAICNKWARAKASLMGGADLVIELPVVYSAQSAEYFAMGAVELLNAVGADFISFGAEDDDTESLTAAARLLISEPKEFKDLLSDALDRGDSFPKARAAAAKELGVGGVLSSPNNILGVEYIKAMLKTSSKMVAVPVKRKGSQHDKAGSASYIRGVGIDFAREYMPDFSYNIVKEEEGAGRAPVDIGAVESAIVSRIRLASTEWLAGISGVAEGLENRLKKGALLYPTIDAITDYVKTKRYTHSRIRRIMVNILLGIRADDIGKSPEYIRVLGMNERGMTVLKKIKKQGTLPVITKTANAPESRMMNLDLASTDIYSLMYPAVSERRGGLDMTTSPVIL
ncbi:MAG: hypothetical protein BWY15_00387 [Firmicutes bacterium ADurb.Bin193]|nr:MAG: hypothetical protein BWY15_00387 [Firmicutes bacterium ADurb.Bin193]